MGSALKYLTSEIKNIEFTANVVQKHTLNLHSSRRNSGKPIK